MISGDIQPIRAKLQTTATTILTGTKQRLLVSSFLICNTNAAARDVTIQVTTSGGTTYDIWSAREVAANETKPLSDAGQHGPLIALADGDVLKGLCTGTNDDVHVELVTTTLGTADIGMVL
jgi:hypothetical protein